MKFILVLRIYPWVTYLPKYKLLFYSRVSSLRDHGIEFLFPTIHIKSTHKRTNKWVGVHKNEIVWTSMQKSRHWHANAQANAPFLLHSKMMCVFFCTFFSFNPNPDLAAKILAFCRSFKTTFVYLHLFFFILKESSSTDDNDAHEGKRDFVRVFVGIEAIKNIVQNFSYSKWLFWVYHKKDSLKRFLKIIRFEQREPAVLFYIFNNFYFHSQPLQYYIYIRNVSFVSFAADVNNSS